MLMENKCSAVTSIKVKLTFDDGSVKERVVGIGDIISVVYNANGLRNKVTGKVLATSAVGTDPKAWYIIVDGSDDFKSDRVRFAPTSILDLEIIRKNDQLEFIQTPIGFEGIPYLRIHRGRLQYSMDGYRWRYIVVDKRDVILPAEGTAPYDEEDIDPDINPHPHYGNHHHCPCTDNGEDDEVETDDDEDIIEDSNY